MKEREPRFAAIRHRLEGRGGAAPVTATAETAGRDAEAEPDGAGEPARVGAPAPTRRPGPPPRPRQQRRKRR
jgi:hypothetical protein